MKEQHNACYNGITPESSNAEFLERVLGKAKKMNDNKKSYNRKPLIIAAAAALTLCVGVSAAAATGLIDFNSLFNGKMFTEDIIVAEEYLATADNFSYNISDEDYMLQLHGVTGTNDYIFGSFEILRKDGAPVTDYYLNNISPSDNLDCDSWWSWLQKDTEIDHDMIHYLDFKINENGNIDGFFGFQTVIDPASSKTVHVSFDTIYEDINYDDAKSASIPLDVSFSFDYTPSETALYSKTIVPATDKDFEITGGHLSFCYGTISCQYNSEDFVGVNNIVLIMDDGTEIPAYVESARATSNSSENVFFEYRENYFESIHAVDVTKISSIMIEGKEYDLT